MTSPLGTIKVGTTSSIKTEASNAEALHKTQETKDKQEMEQATKQMEEDKLLYQTVGEPVFNFFVDSKSISFKAGQLIVDATDTKIIEALECFVSQGIIELVSQSKG